MPNRHFCKVCQVRYAQELGLCRRCANVKISSGPTAREKRVAFPGKGLSRKETLAVSWWVPSSAPDKRAQFIVDAKIRHERRLAKYRTVYTNAAGDVDR